MAIRKLGLGAALGLLLLSLGACDHDHVEHFRNGGFFVPQVEGTLRFSWTIAGSTNKNACKAIGSNQFEAVVADGGLVRFEVEAPCEDFELEVPAPVGRYVARVRLVDAFDLSRTRRLLSDEFTVNENKRTSVAIDFPSSSFTSPVDGGIPSDEDAGSEPDAGVGGDAGATGSAGK